MIELSQSFTFEAAHYLEKSDQSHNRRVHGHSFTVEILIAGEVNPETGILMNLEDLEKLCMDKIHSKLDHSLLNEIEGLEIPSMENISRWIWGMLINDLPYLKKVILSRKTCGQKCIYRG